MGNSLSLLNWGPISLVRRNHGLEHAVLNLLAVSHPHQSFAGHSDSKGFWVVGRISTDVLLKTCQEALKRMKQGERSLAIHANCGTNFVTAGVLAGTMAWLATLRNPNNFKKKLDRWPLLVLIITGATMAAQPLGYKMQEKVSASGDPGNLVIKQIVRYERNGPSLHRILTADSAQPVGE
jgi:hypothetical protein